MEGYDWNKVLFSDEKTFQLGAGPGYAWQQPGERIVQEYVRHAPKLHVWGAIGAHVKTKLYFFQENMNSKLYQKILKSHLKERTLNYARGCPKKVQKNWVFLQDNSKVHKAKKSMECLRELVGDRLIAHPALSPDLNVIENMWSYLDRKVKGKKITSIRSLKTFLTKEWKALPWSEIRKAVDSMERRTQQCRECGGNRLPY